MIGQSVINTKSGGRGRLSTFVAGAFLLVLIIALRDIVFQIPMAALVGVMFMVCVSTFDWSTIRVLRRAPITDSIVMLVTVVTVLATGDLSKGVFAGIILSAIFFVAKISKLRVVSKMTDNNLIYTVEGQVFFASVENLIAAIDFNTKEKDVEIDFSRAHVWDDSGVAAIDKIVFKLKENGVAVKITGLNKSSSHIVNRLALHSKSEG